MTARPNLRDAAVRYAEAGWPIFPLRPGGKIPYPGTGGFKDSTVDVDLVRRWWKHRPASNIGVATGHVFDVLDLDGPEAEAAFDRHQLDNDLPMPGDHDWPHPPVWSATPRGLHCLVQPTGAGNRVGLLPGVDWRGAGGYVVAPPSVRADGRYRWIDDPVGGIPPCPPWLADLARGPAPERTQAPLVVRTGDCSRYAQAALEAELDKVLAAAQGTRNHTLNEAAFSLGQLVAARQLLEHVVYDALVAAATHVGLAGREARATVTSGLRAGMRQPRAVA